MQQNIFQKLIVNKYNPDINIKYQNLVNRSENYEHDNKVWKGIITDQIVDKVLSADDLKLKKDNPDINVTMQKLEQQMYEREQERIIYENSVKMNKMNKQDEEENIIIPEDYVDMKIYHIKENDKLVKEKERYNKLLEDIADII